MKPYEILIFCDDGHGIETAGKRTPKFEDGKFIRENEFNHATKKLFMDACTNMGFSTFDVSPERTDTPLKTRTDRANVQYKLKKFKDYLYISFHFNAMDFKWDDKIGGIETYHYPNSTRGKKLATYIHKELLKGVKMKDRGVKSANFHVLRETNMTAVLLECGFMDNRTEANLMKNIEYQNECAIEAVKGICNYYGIKYEMPKNKLEEYAKIISPNYWKVWIKHFNSSNKLNWEGFLESALKKDLPK